MKIADKPKLIANFIPNLGFSGADAACPCGISWGGNGLKKGKTIMKNINSAEKKVTKICAMVMMALAPIQLTNH